MMKLEAIARLPLVSQLLPGDYHSIGGPQQKSMLLAIAATEGTPTPHEILRQMAGCSPVTGKRAIVSLIEQGLVRCTKDATPAAPPVFEILWDVVGKPKPERKVELNDAACQPRPPIDRVIQMACLVMRIPVAKLSSKSRRRPIVFARAVITVIARRQTLLSFPELAIALGLSNHSTVITAFQRMERRLNHPVGHRDRTLEIDGINCDVEDLIEQVEMLACPHLRRIEAA